MNESKVIVSSFRIGKRLFSDIDSISLVFELNKSQFK